MLEMKSYSAILSKPERNKLYTHVIIFWTFIQFDLGDDELIF